MGNKNSLFIISSPFQALCIIEAIKDYKIVDYKIVILRNKQSQKNNNIEKILNDFSLNYEYIFINSLFFLLIRGVFKQFKKDLYKKKFGFIFIGDYFAYNIRLFSCFFIKKKTTLFLLDDGNATISIYKNGLNKIKILTFKSLIKQILVGFLFLMIDKEKIVFYSIFKPVNDKYRFKQNRLIIYKNNQINNVSNGVYILGSNLSESNLISEAKYLKLVKTIINKYPEKKYYYCPHRGEDVKKLSKIKDTMFYNTEYTIEYDFYKKNVNPEIIIGFGSTALYTLKLLYPNTKVYNYKILLNKKGLNILYNEINNYYKKIGIKIIE